jgi:ubiquinone biosynthesis protein
MRAAASALRSRQSSWRRRRLSHRLVELGLAGRAPRRSPSSGGASRGAFGERLRSASAELGPLFAAYGRYLSSRPDLLPPADAVALAEIPDFAESLSPDVARAMLRTELGAPLEELFSSFEEPPVATGSFHQWHRAVTVDGQPVVIKLVRPQVEELLAEDAELLDLLRPPGLRLDGVAEEFLSSVEASIDLRLEARGLEELAAEAWSRVPLIVPRLHPELSSRRVLCAQWPAGTPLARAAESGIGVQVPRRLCVLWLRQALIGRVVPLEPSSETMLVADSGGFAFLGGSVAQVPTTVQERFGRFLVAVASDEPEEAVALVANEMETEPEAVDREGLLLRLRQVVPFRDGAWTAAGLGLDELLFSYWRTARDCGYRPRGHLLDLIRGLQAVAATARELAPVGDPLREALREVRLEMSFAGAGGGSASGGGMGSVATHAALLSEMPAKIDELLTLMAAGESRLQLHFAEADERRRSGDALIPVVVLGTMLLVLVLVVPRLMDASVLSGGGDQLLTAVAAVLGIALLRAAGRGD